MVRIATAMYQWPCKEGQRIVLPPPTPVAVIDFGPVVMILGIQEQEKANG